MRLLLLLSLTVALVGAKFGNQDLVDHINNLDTTWKAGLNRRFEGVDDSVIKGMMGWIPDPPEKRLPKAEEVELDEPIPESFDARDHWPQCKSIKVVRDQSACGSCWAIAAAEAMTDRICIATDGKSNPRLSTNDIMTCEENCGGCHGCGPHRAWRWWVENGLVTGGNYSSKSGCQPYPFPKCEHHTNKTTYPPCPKTHDTPPCVPKCQSSYPKSYKEDKHYGKKAYYVSGNVQTIQKEIMTSGPLEACFDVYADFEVYSKGVYRHETGPHVGGHCMKMIGWGVEGGTPYWLIANSWNADWGDKGFVKFLRGNDECGIESECVAGIPKLDDDY